MGCSPWGSQRVGHNWATHTYRGRVFWWLSQSLGVYRWSLFSPQGLSAKPRDLRAGEDTFSSPGQSVPRGTQIAEPESGGTDRTPTHGEESRGGILPSGALTEHLPSGGTHVDTAPSGRGVGTRCPPTSGPPAEALSAYTESWDARERTLGHMSGYLQGLFAEY